MSSSTPKPSVTDGKHLVHVPGLSPKQFNLTDPKYHLKCFHCGHDLSSRGLILNVTDDPEELLAGEPETVHQQIVCGPALGGCGYGWTLIVRREAVGGVTLQTMWTNWWLREQSKCEETEHVPKWLQNEY